MPRFVIEREIAGAGDLGPDELQKISQKSCDVLRNMGPEVQGLQSYVTDDRIYCVYIAPTQMQSGNMPDLANFPPIEFRGSEP